MGPGTRARRRGGGAELRGPRGRRAPSRWQGRRSRSTRWRRRPDSLPGIGPAFAEKLAEKGLVTVEDLVWLVPRRYDDVRGARPLAEVVGLPDGQRATFSARVASARMVFARGRRWAEVRLGSVDIGQPASALVRWFNVFAGIDKRMPPGSRVTLSGVVRARGGRVELANPDILAIETDPGDLGAPADGTPGEAARRPPPAVLARYPDVAGVPPGRLRAACAAACARVAGCAEDGVPAVVEAAAGLPGLAETLAQLHAPPPETSPADLAALESRRQPVAAPARVRRAVRARRRDRAAPPRAPRRRRGAVPPRSGAGRRAGRRAAVRADRRAAPHDRRDRGRPGAGRSDEPAAAGRRRRRQDRGRVRRGAPGRARAAARPR